MSSVDVGNSTYVILLNLADEVLKEKGFLKKNADLTAFVDATSWQAAALRSARLPRNSTNSFIIWSYFSAVLWLLDVRFCFANCSSHWRTVNTHISHR